VQLPAIDSIELSNKRVLVRGDLDVPFEDGRILDDTRIRNCLPTFKYVLEKGAERLLILGHIGKYEGPEKTVSTAFLKDSLSELLGDEVNFVAGMPPSGEINDRVVLLDNVRMSEGEEKNDAEFARALAQLADVYVNEAFATSHREHASIVGIPKLLLKAAGLRFAGEVAKLSTILENPKRPVVAMVSGIKKDKLSYIQNFLKFADTILVGGRLPDYIGDSDPLRSNSKVILARLNPDKEDITIHSIETFQKELAQAGTIIVAGVLGKYEEEGHRQGTKQLFEAVAASTAFKLMGGGDSEAAASLFGITDKFDWISTGGGAMLEFLAKGTLPGLRALQE